MMEHRQQTSIGCYTSKVTATKRQWQKSSHVCMKKKTSNNLAQSKSGNFLNTKEINLQTRTTSSKENKGVGMIATN